MDSDIITLLGGKQAVAEALGVSAGAVANWKLETRSIPWKHRPKLARIADERGVSLPPEFLGAG